MSKHTEKLNLYEIEKEHDTFSTFDIDTILNDNWERIDEKVINKNGTVPFIAEQIGVDPTSSQGLATKHYVDTHTTVELGETETTAYRGDRGKIAYDHSQAVGNPHNTTKADLGLNNVQNVDTTTTANITDSSDKRFVTDMQKAALGNISGVNTGDETKAGIISKLGAAPADCDLSNLTSNAKTNLNTAGIRTVVESYVNDASWYRIWSDGWIEQGGSYTGFIPSNANANYQITLLRSFSNIYYTAIGSTNNEGACRLLKYTTSVLLPSNYGGDRSDTICWYACGY